MLDWSFGYVVIGIGPASLVILLVSSNKILDVGFKKTSKLF